MQQTNHQELIAELKKIISEDLDVNLTVDQIDETQPLLEKGLALDSIVIVALINEIEDRFDIEFSDADLRVDTFKSLTRLAELVHNKINKTAS